MTWCIHFYADYQSGFLWPGNDETRETYQIPINEAALPITASTRAELTRLIQWYDRSLNWEYPPDPGPFREEECSRLNAAVRSVLARLREELGSEWTVVDQYVEVHEDPDLDRYLRDPKGFRREDSNG